MRIDKWFMAFFGFLQDWWMSRKWKKMLLPSIPIAAFLIVYGCSVWGSTMDTTRLASWYQELGERELESWESSLTLVEGKEEDSEGEAEKPADDEPKPAISPFAEMLFRRLQVLSPSERSRFVIGVTYAQQGALEQAYPIFDSLAPYGNRGYPPAHAFMAMSLLEQLKKGTLKLSNETRELVFHHIREAQKWDNVPQGLLIDGSGLFHAYAKQTKLPEWSRQSLTLLSKAADRNTKYSLELAKRAEELGNMVIRDAALKRANAYLETKLEEDPNDDLVRAQYADTLAMDGNFEGAEEILLEGLQIRQTELLTRSMSELYRLRFANSIHKEDGRFVGNVDLLDKAMRIDPKNPRIVEEIAKLARMGGQTPTEEMISALQNRLASGQASAVTHAWLSEAYLLRKQYAKAIPHLEQVTTRMPSAAQFSNNLAFVLADLHPERMEEARKYAESAVQFGRLARDPNLADFYDTLGTIYAKLDRGTEAITAYEYAIQLQPLRTDFRERIARAFQEAGQEDMAVKQLRIRDQLLAQEADRRAADQANEENASEPQESSESSE